MSTALAHNYFRNNLSNRKSIDLYQLKNHLINPQNSSIGIFKNIISFLSEKSTHILLFLMCFFLFSIVYSQPTSLFESDEILELTLQGDLRTAFKDRGDDPLYHPATLHYQEDQTIYDIPVRIKSRGNFRKSLGGCKYPPLFLNFKKKATPNASIFRDQDKTKLVTPCKGDEYVLNEYLVYKLYNLLTPKSFRARLVKVIYEDTVKNKSSDPYFGILLEEEKQMAKRNQSKLVEIEKLNPQRTQGKDYLTMTVFQYMIGNTDWGVEYQQNIKLLAIDSTSLPFAVPYDFDHAGIVRAPYAKPAPELKMTSTLQRRYRGYCIKDMNQYTPIFELFNQLKDDFYAIYSSDPLFNDNYKKQTIRFLDKFYETINDPKEATRDFLYPCDPSGTGNVIIKGLQK